MRLIFQTYRKPQILAIRFKVNKPCEIVAIGFDSDNPSNVYFERDAILADQENVLFFNMPTSPNKLQIKIYGVGAGSEINNSFTILDYRQMKLRTIPILLKKHTKDFLYFINDFINIQTELDFGTYQSDCGKFIIEYMDVMRKNGIIEPTPARIEVTEDYIQVSKRYFDQMTIPAKRFVLLHEYSHNFLNVDQNSEPQADLNAAKIYLATGNSFNELINRTEDILTKTDENDKRIKYLYDFAKGHKLLIDTDNDLKYYKNEK